MRDGASIDPAGPADFAEGKCRSIRLASELNQRTNCTRADLAESSLRMTLLMQRAKFREEQKIDA
jgi:hypothetical protein